MKFFYKTLQLLFLTALPSFSADTPANAVRTPQESLALLKTRTGLETTLFASEPLLLNPSSIDVDARGRVWVAEIVNYRVRLGTRPEGDRILILEDTDADGKADKQTIFFQSPDIDSPHGIAVLGNKAIVSAKGHVYLLSDDNGDDKADTSVVLFSGIDGAQHDHSVHSFNFGPDGKLYFNMGNTGGQLKDKDGKIIVDMAGNEVKSTREPYQDGMVFRCDLDGSHVETLGWNFRNNWEVAVDSYGGIWQSDNDDDGNQGVRINFVMEYGNYGYKDEKTGAAWTDQRTSWEDEVPRRHWHLNDPGVIPNLLQTGAGSPTGIVIYEGSLLPAELQNQIIHTDAGPNIVRAYPVTAEGAGYKATIDNLLDGANTEQWFRPSDVNVAPDGSLMIADWYDPGVGGHAMGDVDHGRIYRIAPTGSKYNITPPDLSTPDAAAAALCSPNRALHYLAWMQLKAHGAAAIPALEKIWKGENPRFRARALWFLGKMEGQGPSFVASALSDKNPDLRITGIRLAKQLGLATPALLQPFAHDESPAVRREIAIALRFDKSPEASALWVELASQYDGKDRWYLEALGIGADLDWNSRFAAWLAKVGDQWNSPIGHEIIWRSRASQSAEYLAKIIKAGPLDENQEAHYLRAFDFLTGPEKDAALQSLLE